MAPWMRKSPSLNYLLWPGEWRHWDESCDSNPVTSKCLRVWPSKGGRQRACHSGSRECKLVSLASICWRWLCCRATFGGLHYRCVFSYGNHVATWVLIAIVGLDGVFVGWCFCMFVVVVFCVTVWLLMYLHWLFVLLLLCHTSRHCPTGNVTPAVTRQYCTMLLLLHLIYCTPAPRKKHWTGTWIMTWRPMTLRRPSATRKT